MKVLFVTSAYPTHADDARGIFIHRLARELCRQGAQVTVIAPGAPSAPRNETVDGVHVHRAKYWIQRRQHLATELSGIIPALRQRPWLLFQVPSLMASLTWHAVRRARYFDVIHGHWLYPSGIAAAIAAKCGNRPLVVTTHGGDLNRARRCRGLDFISKLVSQGSDVCIGVSMTLCERLRAYGVSPDRTVYIPVGADVGGCLQRRANESWSVLREFEDFAGFRMLYVGSLISEKSVETLLFAHSKLAVLGYPVACAIVGPGPEKDRLMSIVKEHQLKNVFIVGGQPPSTVGVWMSAAHTLVLPSLSEGQPTVVMEAMAVGLPVVATDIPGMRELVEAEKTGLLFPPRDVDGLVKCIERLIKDEPLRKQMGELAKEHFGRKGLSVSQVAGKHIAVYQALIALKRPSRATYGPH